MLGTIGGAVGGAILANAASHQIKGKKKKKKTGHKKRGSGSSGSGSDSDSSGKGKHKYHHGYSSGGGNVFGLPNRKHRHGSSGSD